VKAKMNITLQYELKVVDEESKEDSQITPLHEKSQNSNTLTEKGDSNSRVSKLKKWMTQQTPWKEKEIWDKYDDEPWREPASLKKAKLLMILAKASYLSKKYR